MSRMRRWVGMALVAALATVLAWPISAGIKGEQPVAWPLLAKLDYKTGKYPAEVEKVLAAKQLRVSGYPVPVEVTDFDNISEFILVATQFGCCQGPPPDPNQIIDVKLTKPVSFEKLMGVVFLTGKLSVSKSAKGEYGYSLAKGEVFEPEYDF